MLGLFGGPSIDWDDIAIGSGGSGSNNNQKMPFTGYLNTTQVGSPGSIFVGYVKNGGDPVATTGGSFAVTAGDLVHFAVGNKSSAGVATFTVSLVDGPVLDTFTVTIS